MAVISEDLMNIDVRNQVLLERLKAGEHKKFEPFLKKLDRQIRSRLMNEGETIATKKRLNALLADIKAIQKAVYDDYIGQLTLDLTGIGVSQAGFEAKSYEKVVVDYDSILPSADQVTTAIRVNPLQVANYTGDPLLAPFMKDWTNSQSQRIQTTIQQGFYQGQTNAEIARNIRGTRANRFNDGDLAKVNRANNTLVRTAVQHASTQSRHETMKRNSDLIKGYEWVSTLDSKTTPQCQALDGRKFKVGEGPLPPIHPGCRSTTTPVLSEKYDFLKTGATRASRGAEGGKQIPAGETYYSWLKKQPASFQNDAIGPKRAKLLRDGGLSAEEFSKLSLNKNFEPLTLAEMESKAPNAFEKAGL